jgi:hypothetical protein
MSDVDGFKNDILKLLSESSKESQISLLIRYREKVLDTISDVRCIKDFITIFLPTIREPSCYKPMTDRIKERAEDLQRLLAEQNSLSVELFIEGIKVDPIFRYKENLRLVDDLFRLYIAFFREDRFLIDDALPYLKQSLNMVI